MQDTQNNKDMCFQSTSRMQFLGVEKWCAVQCFFLTPNKNMFAEKSVKSERFLAVLREHIIFNVN